MAIATRDIMGKIRESGEVTSGPSPFSKLDRSKFLNQMETMVRSAKVVNHIDLSGFDRLLI